MCKSFESICDLLIRRMRMTVFYVCMIAYKCATGFASLSMYHLRNVWFFSFRSAHNKMVSKSNFILFLLFNRSQFCENIIMKSWQTMFSVYGMKSVEKVRID